METLNADLLGSRSATTTLETWCADHDMAPQPKLVAVRVDSPEKPASAAQRAHLQVGPNEPIRYRRVKLTCGDRVLSEADNWYVPSRLTPAMNHLLDTTDIPFGRVVAPMKPTRQTIAADVLWHVLPPGWELRATSIEDRPDKVLDIPPVLFEHHAILYDEERRPFSEVDEHYQRAILPFGQKP